MKHKHMYDLCKTHVHSYVLAELEDGSSFDGIVTGLDEEYAYFAVPNDSEISSQNMSYGHEQRQIGWGSYGYSGFGFPGYGFYGPFSSGARFRRLVLPLAALTTLTVLPWY